jgi:hypothetical protein
MTFFLVKFFIVISRVAPAFFLIADPDGFQIRIPDPDPGFDDLKLKKIYSWKLNFYFIDQKLPFTYP